MTSTSKIVTGQTTQTIVLAVIISAIGSGIWYAVQQTGESIELTVKNMIGDAVKEEFDRTMNTRRTHIINQWLITACEEQDNWRFHDYRYKCPSPEWRG